MKTIEQIILEEIATGVAVAAIPGLVISQQAAEARPVGEYFRGRSNAIQATLSALRKDGVLEGWSILISAASEAGVTFGFPTTVAGYGAGYHHAKINPRTCEVTSIGECGHTPAAEL